MSKNPEVDNESAIAADFGLELSEVFVWRGVLLMRDSDCEVVLLHHDCLISGSGEEDGEDDMEEGVPLYHNPLVKNPTDIEVCVACGEEVRKERQPFYRPS
ncbi:MAG: hypothetical protein OXU75_00050 [Deltaproteobacteria bacterium]|nr:hypothetical protein [Deltaproteobacteria bacterium]